MVKINRYIGFGSLIILALAISCLTFAADSQPVKEEAPPAPAIELDSVLRGLEERYQAPSFSARFYQESPLPDIQITERAEGKAFFKRPGKFRWSYETPDVLEYISDGIRLWIYSPVDNNVWIGTAEDFFGKGGSASVLTDLKQLKDRFDVSLADPLTDTSVRLKLIPKGDGQGLTHMFLSVDKSTYDILNIVSFNLNGEETRIKFETMTYDAVTDDSLFTFSVPENAIVIPLE